VLSLFMRNSGIEQSYSSFRTFINKVFSFGSTHEQRLAKIFKGLISGMYDSEALEEALKSEFGLHCRFFEYNPTKVPGIKLGIPAVKVDKTSTNVRIFTNYNGSARQNPDHSSGMISTPFPGVMFMCLHSLVYRLERPAKVEDEYQVWQV
jgi:hypothetical protein